MSWFVDFLTSSIGKKLMMALTGLCFIAFLVVHLAGNLTIYGGSEMFISYADHLHSLGILVNIAEMGLLALALVHVLTGTTLFYQNYTARPVRYKVNKSAGGRTIGSMTMPYTGFLLLLFIVLHLLNFHFVDKTNTNIWIIVSEAFANPAYVAIYVAAMIVAAVHVSHGLWSAFQTLGISHVKYTPAIRALSLVVSVVFGVGFGFLPIYISLAG